MEPHTVYEVITHSAGNSWIFRESGAAHPLNQVCPLSAKMDIFVKDLNLVHGPARELANIPPVASRRLRLFTAARAPTGF
ncbi:hypothetical protein DSL92_02115 [Billgrantia gudaonensis]|uniref:3-hydroxyisobutyrate dehydrogenase-like NAD-binding domain-containing protein n=1 Tax=Billgrantia gudaonensis TaxID=376427 RepID=A0A3S0Q1I8_9GAMM|nr:hypothetical protein DSL92_02115 [Halomonas gudaonensis]